MGLGKRVTYDEIEVGDVLEWDDTPNRVRMVRVTGKNKDGTIAVKTIAMQPTYPNDPGHTKDPVYRYIKDVTTPDRLYEKGSYTFVGIIARDSEAELFGEDT